MITEEDRQWLEGLFQGFTNALFVRKEVPTMYVVIVDRVGEVVPPPPSHIDRKTFGHIVSEYARVRSAQYILHVSEGWAVSSEDPETPKGKIEDHPDRREVLVMMVGEPSGILHAISGDVERACDGTPYVLNWNWIESLDNPTDLIHSFCDD